MSGLNVVFYGGSQEIQDTVFKEKIQKDIESFLLKNKEKIDMILFGGQNAGVMGMVFQTAHKVGVPIKGYSIERFRKWDEGNGVNIDFFENDDERNKQFVDNGDIFVSLPGGLGTIKETLVSKDLILESKQNKKIYIPSYFTAFHTMISTLKNDNMMYGDDSKTMIGVESLKNIQI